MREATKTREEGGGRLGFHLGRVDAIDGVGNCVKDISASFKVDRCVGVCVVVVSMLV